MPIRCVYVDAKWLQGTTLTAVSAAWLVVAAFCGVLFLVSCSIFFCCFCNSSVCVEAVYTEVTATFGWDRLYVELVQHTWNCQAVEAQPQQTLHSCGLLVIRCSVIMPLQDECVITYA